MSRDDLGEPASIEELETLSGKKRRARLDAIKDACSLSITACRSAVPGIAGPSCQRYSCAVRFQKIWAEQCRATKRIKRAFGAKSALDYLIGEKLVTFAAVAEKNPEFAAELPRFLAAVGRLFNEYEIAGYVASQRPGVRTRLRALLYLH